MERTELIGLLAEIAEKDTVEGHDVDDHPCSVAIRELQLSEFSAWFYCATIKEEEKMLLKEDEAKEKICPYLVDPVKLSLDHSIVAKPQNCRATGCMMWRKDYCGVKGDVGYCGLAGKPEKQ